MASMYNEFLGYLESGDKESCVGFALDHLADGSLTVVSLYDDILTPALNEDTCAGTGEDICIWQEHVRTSIVRTIIESAFQYVMKEKAVAYPEGLKGKVVVLCPPGEAHEVGARMVADYFILAGYDSVFVGANTPIAEIKAVIKHYQPDYVAISISNVYNLLAAEKTVRKLTADKDTSKFKVILGGRACKTNQVTCEKFNADMILDSFEDIRRLREGDGDAGI